MEATDKRIALQIDPTSIVVNDKKLDLSVFMAILETGNRVLWQFVEKDGIIQAVPYSEAQVIWISEGR